jgi:hypothetical protein
VFDQRDETTNDGAGVLAVRGREREMRALFGRVCPNVVHEYLLAEHGNKWLEIGLGPDVNVDVEEVRRRRALTKNGLARVTHFAGRLQVECRPLVEPE